MLERVRYVSFAGAGTRGAAYGGFLDAVEDHISSCGMTFEEWRNQMRGVAGTSVGAVAALFLALGLERGLRETLFAEFTDMRNVLRRPDMSLLYLRQGFDDGCGLKDLIKRTLTMGGMSAMSTLSDVRRLLRVDFVCVCTDLSTGTSIYLTAESHPTMAVYDAIYASSCVPFLFVPSLVENSLVVDGCMSCNHPTPFPIESTLFVSVDSSPLPVTSGDWSSFLQGVIRCAIAAQKTGVQGGVSVVIQVPEDVQMFDVHLCQSDALRIFHAGYMHTADAFHKGKIAEVASKLVGFCCARITCTEGCTFTDESPPTAECLDAALRHATRP